MPNAATTHPPITSKEIIPFPSKNERQTENKPKINKTVATQYEIASLKVSSLQKIKKIT